MRRCRSVFAEAKYLIAGACAAGALIGMSANANADGMAPRAAPVAQVAPTSWSGFYFGMHSGFVWSDFDASVAGVSAFSVSHDAELIGGQIGIQHQFGNLVVGLEGTMMSTFRDDYASTPCPNTSFTCAARIDDIITIGPRLGWAMGKWMPYLTGGYANGGFSEKISIIANSANPYQDHQRHSGWFIGGGVEMALAAGWTTGLEYRHYEFDDATYNVTRTTAGGVIDTSQPANVADATADAITLRVSWKFDRPAPVAAPLK
jgi:opacity protein-like surface antigen